MRWFVVRTLAPLAYRPCGTAHAHPPGPGFPEHAPSVYTTVAARTGTSSWSTPTSPLVSTVAAPCSPRGSDTCAGPRHPHRGCLRGANPRWAAVAVDRDDTGRLLEQGLGKVALCRNARCRPRSPRSTARRSSRRRGARETAADLRVEVSALPSSVVDRRPGTAWRPPEPSRPAGARAVTSPDLARAEPHCSTSSNGVCPACIKQSDPASCFMDQMVTSSPACGLRAAGVGARHVRYREAVGSGEQRGILHGLFPL